MAQQVDDLKGNDQKEGSEVSIGKNKKYKTEISIDSTQKELTLEVQDKQSKHIFKGVYPMSSLHESGFHSQHGLNDIKKVLETAFNDNDDTLNLTINYGNDKGLSDKYRNGDYMLWTILHDLKILKLTYILKLNKVKQSDSDILYQIIDDLSNEIKELKIENRKLNDTIIKMHPVIARWDCKGKQEGNNRLVKWTDLSFMTKQGYFQLTHDSLGIKILKNGLYRIKCRLWMEGRISYAYYNFRIGNKTMQAVYTMASLDGKFNDIHFNGLMDSVYELRSNQILSFQIGSGRLYEGRNCEQNNFMHIEKILDY